MAPERSFSAPKGTNDILPPESWRWWVLINSAENRFKRAGYAPVETPIFEHTEVFERGVGQGSEVVTKQMYTFEDRAGRSLTLRPEGTAPVVRAVLEHGLHRRALPVKLFYSGPMFRQERPQKGRYRQFSQLGIEAIGSDDPRVDAEVIYLGMDFLAKMQTEPVLRLNSIGHPDPSCRDGYLRTLVTFLENNRDRLAEEDRDRASTNPLRTFDSKESRTVEVMREAPLITEHLCDACAKHFDEVRSLLDDLAVPYELEPRLVRGLDYYARTAFEYVSPRLGAQDALGGGGRYDGLAEVLGGTSLPGIGFALGLDRILLASRHDESINYNPPVAYIVALGERAEREALLLATHLREHGLTTDLDLMRRSMKGQMKDAARVGAFFALILGEEEVGSGRVTVKDMRSSSQVTVARDDIVTELRKQMSGPTGEVDPA